MAEAPSPTTLTASQRIAVRSLLHLHEAAVARLAAEQREVHAEIERDHGLPAGALGTTHRIDLAAGVVVPMPDQDS